jgi:uncharacterized protein
MMSLLGHFWTIAPNLQRRLLPQDQVQAEDWSCSVPDERYGTVTLHGRLSHDGQSRVARGASELLIAVHGLGGSSESGYLLGAARAAMAAGLSCLRLNQRGADRRGEDYYHAGLWEDLGVVIGDPSLEKFEAIYLLGYSIGGQLCVHWAAKGTLEASRVRAVASVCAPLDLAQTAANLDSLGNSVYRAHVLHGLRKAYGAVAKRREVPVPMADAMRITRMREWDERITVPRFGFRDADHYYAEASAGRCLRDVRCPTMLVVAEQDPMVPFATVEPALREVSSHVVVKRTTRGGHVGFPANFSLDQPGPLGIEQQLITWLRTVRG